jgi:hypothetical protein
MIVFHNEILENKVLLINAQPKLNIYEMQRIFKYKLLDARVTSQFDLVLGVQFEL